MSGKETAAQPQADHPSATGDGPADGDLNRLVQLASRSEWPPVETLLRSIEKSGARPLAGLRHQETGMTPLMFAVKDSRTTFIDRFIDLGSDINARNNADYNALHVAAMFSKEDVVRLLLQQKGIDISAPGGAKQQTAVHLAAGRATGAAIGILRLLLAAAGRDIRLCKDTDGKIPLLLAVEAGNQNMCRELLSVAGPEQLRSCSSDTGDTALHLAAKKRNLSLLKVLIESGAPVDLQNRDGQTILHLAAALGDEDLVKYLYLAKATASVTDNQDRTPMHMAAEHGHANVMELLAEKFKASILERTKDGSTLMHIASLNGHSDCATILFKKGVHLQMPNKNGARSIHTAAECGHVAIINALIQKGEKVDIKTSDNYTPLLIACESAKPAVVEALLGYGADVHNRGGRMKETALHIAARVPEGSKCALVMLRSGADPNLSTEDGQTAVHVAAKYGNLNTLLHLIEEGGNPLTRSKSGETPLHLASRACKADVVKCLLDFVTRTKGKEVCVDYVNSVNEDGATALHYAGKIAGYEVSKETPGEDKMVIKLLMEGGANIHLTTKQTSETAFHFSAIVGNNTILGEMITQLSATNLQKAQNMQNNVGWTALLIACHQGHTRMVRHLLDSHARVDVFDNEGRSALHLAAEKGYLQVCDALLTHKAFINSKSRVGLTALHLAAMQGFDQLCKFLVVDHNATIDILTLKKQTPLHLASAEGQLQVCKLLLELGASIEATDDYGQKPIHVAALNNYPEVAQLFLHRQHSLVMAPTKEGNTCAHLAAMSGSLRVIEELMKFDRGGVICTRNKLMDSTPLQLAAEGGHADLVRTLIKAGASAIEENKQGFTAIHLAAKNGHDEVLEVLRSSQSLKVTSKKLGMTALHVAAYYGQSDTVRELLAHVPATVKSEPPQDMTLVEDLGSESGLTPLHLAAYSGNENVVRLLLNSPGVQVDAPSNDNGYNPLHLACLGGHINVVGLLLSRAAEMLHSVDKHGKTGLHLAATRGHKQMVEVLLGQGAEIDATDKNGWTALHWASRAGWLTVVRLLVESGATPRAETHFGSAPIWFAAAQGHNSVLEFLMTQEHDSYNLINDTRFVYNLMICSRKNGDKPLQEFILVSPAPVDIAAKLSAIYADMSTREKERHKDLVLVGKQCEYLATELLAAAVGADSASRLLKATDRKNAEFLDVLISNEQKEVIAHSVVQRYLKELWLGNLKWPPWRLLLLFVTFLLVPPVWLYFSLPLTCMILFVLQELWLGNLKWPPWRLLLLFVTFLLVPPVWLYFSLPLGHKYNQIPVIKLMSFLTSHIQMMVFLLLVGITPLYPTVRPSILPYWTEMALLLWLSGLLLAELSRTTERKGLAWVKLAVLLITMPAIALHVLQLFLSEYYWPQMMYIRNQLLAFSFLLACVQILDFLSFHHLFGPWAIIIGNLLQDVARFVAVLALFVFGFSMKFVAMSQAIKSCYDESGNVMSEEECVAVQLEGNNTVDVPLAIEILGFSVFSLIAVTDLEEYVDVDHWSIYLIKIVFAIYMLVSNIVLINLLIAMMTDTYQNIQAQSDTEWKYGLAKLIRNMQKTTVAPPPINLVTVWLFYFYTVCKKKLAGKKRPSLVQMLGIKKKDRVSARTKMGNKWLSKVNKARIAPKETKTISVVHLSPTGSQLFASSANRLENIVDWATVVEKFRALIGNEAVVNED